MDTVHYPSVHVIIVGGDSARGGSAGPLLIELNGDLSTCMYQCCSSHRVVVERVLRSLEGGRGGHRHLPLLEEVQWSAAGISVTPALPASCCCKENNYQACEKRRLWGNNDYNRAVEEVLEEKAALGDGARHRCLHHSAAPWHQQRELMCVTTKQDTVSSIYFSIFGCLKDDE
ncbi:hypothetical protein EYF80_018413 [Liparis tanakae]|uniref:Uncharacterized protein n=1 Tax=Liparis tanakae TaxID=230148 RepID=A0A4Z2I1E7_9TELE|nr:hypothetical protein EYF80_018413 [Liparis tanakae]